MKFTIVMSPGHSRLDAVIVNMSPFHRHDLPLYRCPCHVPQVLVIIGQNITKIEGLDQVPRLRELWIAEGRLKVRQINI